MEIQIVKEELSSQMKKRYSKYSEDLRKEAVKLAIEKQ